MKRSDNVDQRTSSPFIFPEPSFVEALKDRVRSDSGMMALEIADKLSDMILFHSRVRRNGIKMMQPITEEGS